MQRALFRILEDFRSTRMIAHPLTESSRKLKLINNKQSNSNLSEFKRDVNKKQLRNASKMPKTSTSPTVYLSSTLPTPLTLSCSHSSSPCPHPKPPTRPLPLPIISTDQQVQITVVINQLAQHGMTSIKPAAIASATWKSMTASSNRQPAETLAN